MAVTWRRFEGAHAFVWRFGRLDQFELCEFMGTEAAGARPGVSER
jgi:hypothetical protein